VEEFMRQIHPAWGILAALLLAVASAGGCDQTHDGHGHKGKGKGTNIEHPGTHQAGAAGHAENAPRGSFKSPADSNEPVAAPVKPGESGAIHRNAKQVALPGLTAAAPDREGNETPEKPDDPSEWPGLPAPVSLVADGAPAKLSMSFKDKNVSVMVEIPPGAVKSGTEVTLMALPKSKMDGRTPGFLVDDISFRLLPHGLTFDNPLMVSVYYKSELNPHENYSLLYWDKERSRYERMPIVAKDSSANFVAFEVDHFSDFSMVYTLVEGLYLDRISGGQWKLHMYFEGWPGLKSAQVTAESDGAPAALSNPDAGKFDEDSVGYADIIVNGGGGGYGWHSLDVYVDIVQIDEETKKETNYRLDLWKQGVVTDWPTLGDEQATELLSQFGPVFQFAEGEEYYPVTIDSFIDIATEIRMPSGRVHYLGGGDAWSDLPILGDSRAALIYKGKDIEPPINASEGAVYGQAFDVGNGAYALLYTLYFPWSQDLGNELGTWGGHRGDIKFVTIMVKGAPGSYQAESMTLSQHRMGSLVEYLGDEDVPVWQLTSWEGGMLTVPWNETLRCKKFAGEENEEHPWVFVGKLSHALYPRAGKYKISIPGKGKTFEEQAGGFEYKIWQPAGFHDVCQPLKQYDITLHPLVGDLTSSSDNGYMLFSGKFGGGRFARNGLAPYTQAWNLPLDWVSKASTGTFDEGTNCYRCVPWSTLQTIKGMWGAWCYWSMWICMCSQCGAVDGDAFIHFPDGFECNDPQFCNQHDMDGLCKTGLTVDWVADAPFNGWVTPDKDQPLHAKVWVIIPYGPTCYMSAISGTGVKAYICGAPACCQTPIGYVEGECYPSF